MLEFPVAASLTVAVSVTATDPLVRLGAAVTLDTTGAVLSTGAGVMFTVMTLEFCAPQLFEMSP